MILLHVKMLTTALMINNHHQYYQSSNDAQLRATLSEETSELARPLEQYGL